MHCRCSVFQRAETLRDGEPDGRDGKIIFAGMPDSAFVDRAVHRREVTANYLGGFS